MASHDLHRQHREIAALFAAQHAVVARSQILRVGVSASAISRRLGSGEWVAVLPSVYSLAAAPKNGRQGAMAGALWGGTEALISHRSAAALWNLQGVKQHQVELTIPTRSGLHSKRLKVHRADLGPRDRRRIDEIPVTSPERTLIDLAVVLDVGALEIALEDALRKGLTNVSKVQRHLGDFGHAGRTGSRRLAELLAMRGPIAKPTDSTLEVLAIGVLRRFGLPEPTRQHRVVHNGAFIGRIDLCYPEAQLVIEADGFEWHSGRQVFESDRIRQNELVALGWRVIRVTKDQLKNHSERFAEITRGLLGAYRTA